MTIIREIEIKDKILIVKSKMDDKEEVLDAYRPFAKVMKELGAKAVLVLTKGKELESLDDKDLKKLGLKWIKKKIK